MLEGLTSVDLQSLGIVALLLFVAVFVTIVVRTLTRPRAEVERQSRLPLDDGEAIDESNRSEGVSS